MIAVVVREAVYLLAIVYATLAGGDAAAAITGVTPLKAATPGELQRNLLVRKADVGQFRLRGPFAVVTHEDYELRLSPSEHVTADLYLSVSAEKAPLVILMHGYDNSKEDHAVQAMHLASWGIHCLAVQLPKRSQWVRNGRTLARVTAFIHRHADTVDHHIDARKIILAGHSFGASSVAIALAEHAPALGGILLDPAAVGKGLPNLLHRIDKPVMVLGADESIFPARGRDYFYRFIRSSVAEISIRGAGHEDAEFPLENPGNAPGTQPSASEDHRVSFLSALTSAAVSLASTGRFDYAWKSFDDAMKSGTFINPRRK